MRPTSFLPIIGCLMLLATTQSVAAVTTPGTCLSGATPFPLTTDGAILPGYYLPGYNQSDSATWPVSCAATDDCTLLRLTSRWCDPQGTYEPKVCDEGYYCPTPTEMIECPKGYVCPRGQFEPIACGDLTVCPAGSSKKQDVGGFVAIFFLDLGLVILYFIVNRWRRYTRGKRDEQYKEVQLCSVNPALYQKGAQFGDLPTHSKLLCQGFQRARRELPAMRLEFDNLSLTIPAGKDGKPLTILKGVTGSVEPGKVTAVMGPSGAGKTTFLNTLLGKVDSSWQRGGTLTVNGVDEELSRFRSIVGFVPQEDIMHRDLTVFENIEYAADVRLPRDFTAKHRADHINATIAAMQLRHVQDSRIGDENIRGISGGQRKRCNIGMEVAAAPSLLLLDEPTSGLDSTAAMEICQVLKDIARVTQTTVAMVIHQPRVEIWEQLDELLLLAPGGLTVYQGPQRVAVKYFQERFDIHLNPRDNPADALMDLIAEQANEFVAAWKDGGADVVHELVAQVGLSPSPPVVVPSDEELLLSSDYDIAMRPIMPQTIHMPSSVPIADPIGKVVKVSPKNGKDVAIDIIQTESFAAKGSLRHAAAFFRQMKYAFTRSLWKQLANPHTLYLETGLGLLAGAAMGGLLKVTFQAVLLPPYTLLSPTPLDSLVGTLVSGFGAVISLAAVSAGVAVFGEETAIYRREVAAGHSHLAYYIGVNFAQFPRLFIDAVHFAGIFHLLNRPLTNFGTFLGLSFLLYSAVYGIAFLVSQVVSRKNAPLLGVVLCLLLSNMVAKGGFPEGIQQLSVSRWAAQAMFDIETKPFMHIMSVDATADRLGYKLNSSASSLGVMFILGLLYRLIAYLAMMWRDRDLLFRSSCTFRKSTTTTIVPASQK